MARFIHASDLHVSSKDSAEAAVSRKRVEQMISLIQAMRSRPDFVLITGDLADEADFESYNWLSQRLSALTIPLLLALGNHDKRGPFHRAFPGKPGGPDGSVDYDAALAGAHVIVLDSSEPGTIAGALAHSQISRLRTALRNHPDLPKVLAVHHPPLTRSGGYAWASLTESATQALAREIEGFDVQAILCGHVHVNRIEMWQGIPVLTTQGLHSQVDPLMTDGLSLLEGAGFSLCSLDQTGFRWVHVPLAHRVELARFSAADIEGV